MEAIVIAITHFKTFHLDLIRTLSGTTFKVFFWTTKIAWSFDDVLKNKIFSKSFEKNHPGIEITATVFASDFKCLSMMHKYLHRLKMSQCQARRSKIKLRQITPLKLLQKMNPNNCTDFPTFLTNPSINKPQSIYFYPSKYFSLTAKHCDNLNLQVYSNEFDDFFLEVESISNIYINYSISNSPKEKILSMFPAIVKTLYWRFSHNNSSYNADDILMEGKKAQTIEENMSSRYRNQPKPVGICKIWKCREYRIPGKPRH